MNTRGQVGLQGPCQKSHAQHGQIGAMPRKQRLLLVLPLVRAAAATPRRRHVAFAINLLQHPRIHPHYRHATHRHNCPGNNSPCPCIIQPPPPCSCSVSPYPPAGLSELLTKLSTLNPAHSIMLVCTGINIGISITPTVRIESTTCWTIDILTVAVYAAHTPCKPLQSMAQVCLQGSHPI